MNQIIMILNYLLITIHKDVKSRLGDVGPLNMYVNILSLGM
jgi:hypothetical protein